MKSLIILLHPFSMLFGILAIAAGIRVIFINKNTQMGSTYILYGLVSLLFFNLASHARDKFDLEGCRERYYERHEVDECYENEKYYRWYRGD